MHYLNGREAKIGDTIIANDCNGIPMSAIVVKTNTQSDSCNLICSPLTNSLLWVTAKDCIHSEDAFSSLATGYAMDANLPLPEVEPIAAESAAATFPEPVAEN